MPGVCHFLLGCFILGCIPCGSWAWTVSMPSNIKAMLGSCVIIPCSFDYYENPPHNPNRVVWYQYVRHGYPLVYDNWNSKSVIDKFRGKTSRVITFRGGKECSLKISPVTWEHHRQRIYPWVDPENVGRGTYRFFDKTVTIEVTDRADRPEILISGDMTVGRSVTVQCSVYHSCFTNLPTLSLNIPLQHHEVDTSLMTDGTFKTTLTTELVIVKDHQTVECSVRHPGGQRAKSSRTFNAKCSFWPITIKDPGEFLEEQPSKVTCTAEYTCPQHAPVFKWNYDSMPANTDVTKISETVWRSVSTLTFTASASDNGRSLKCVVQFTDSESRAEVSVILRVKRTIRSVGWHFTTPDSVTGMKGSCVVIPCRFTYSGSMPADLRVIWYLFQGNQYSPVFDERQNVIGRYRGMTSLTGDVGKQECSLKIDKLDKINGQDRLFPWIDKNPIAFYHMEGHSFYDKTTQIVILDDAPEPQLSISNVPRVGEESRVTCSAQHTCLSSPPILTISGILGSDQSTNTAVSEGVWENRVERVWTPKEEDQSVKCTVRYQGGQTATSELRLNVECPHEEIRMTEPPSSATEGVAQSVICSVSYKCRKNTPTIVWNYSDMQSSISIKKLSIDTSVAQSNLTFIGSLDDDGKTLTCTAKFTAGETSDSGTIHVKKYEKQLEAIEVNEAFHALAGEVPFRFTALTRSCVVLPCSFQQQEKKLVTKAVWAKQNGGNIYHNAQSRVLDHFKGRTRILGAMREGNCSLEIDDVKPFDNGPFCFHAEHKNLKYRFNNSCVFVVMKASPEKPLMTQIPEEVDAGAVVTVSCSVTHTCSSHPPEFSWSVSDLTKEATHTMSPQGTWKTTSTITFLADGGDGEKRLTCTATYWRGKKQSSSAQLTVKGSLSFQLKRSLPVTIPVSVLVLSGIMVAAVAIFKRKQTRRPPPRPEKRRSLLERLSSQKGRSRQPPRPEKRRSFWSRFSRRSEDQRVGWENDTKSRVEDITVYYRK